jgi:hypothetical protein
MTLRRFAENWGKLLKSREYLFSLFMALVIWVAGYFLYEIAISYVDGLKGVVTVKDLMLDLLPLVDLRFLYVYGITLALFFLFCYILVLRPDLLPFALKFYAAVFIVRTVFICLTHLGPPEGFFIYSIASDFSYWPFSHMMHSNDLFFSGHVAYPFLGALLLNKIRPMFYFFLGVSVLMAVTVLMMRIHYSIDVFAAYFIVYGVYAAVKRIFGAKDLSFHHLLTK